MREIFKLNRLSTKHKLRSWIISVAGKVFHVLLSWWDQSLAETGRWYIDKTQTIIDINTDSSIAIQDYKKWSRWITISNHVSWVFSDYLPLFTLLWDECLERNYTWAYNQAMNQREFPNYIFRSATLVTWTKQEVSQLHSYITQDMQCINNWWTAFIIPSWANTEHNASFGSIYKRMIDLSEPDLPILANKVHHSIDMWYRNIAKSMLLKNLQPTITIESRLTTAKDWKSIQKSEMKKYYNSLFE